MTTKRTTKSADAFEAMPAFNTETFKAGYEKMAESFSAVADFHKGSVEAMIASVSALAKGVEKISTENAGFLKASFEESVATAKAASTSKSVQEAVDINSEFVRASIEKNLGQFNKVSELWLETARGAAEPITVRYSELVEKIQTYRP